MKKITLLTALIVSLTSLAAQASSLDSEEGQTCMTHEKNEGKYFRIAKVIQKLTWTSRLDEATIKTLVSFDAQLWDLILEVSEAKEIISPDITPEQALDEYFDDIAVEWIEMKERPKKNYLRFNLGVGGGNGMYLVIEQSLKGGASYKLLSKTFDREVIYCHPKLEIK